MAFIGAPSRLRNLSRFAKEIRHGKLTRWSNNGALLTKQRYSAVQAPVSIFCREFSSQEEPKAEDAEKETFGFKAETSKLLDIVTHSIYTDKEIFLRELVSNAADACEKFRHVSSRGDKVNFPERDLGIHIRVDKDEGTITMEDTGIGMTKAELMENLGTIAKSGSKTFVQAHENASDDLTRNVIGQFGVGFYSAFMVADKVIVYTSSASDDGVSHCWESSGTENFSIREAVEFKGPGTKIVMHVKPDLRKEYLDTEFIKRIIKRYSNYVGFPVFVDDDKANEVNAIWTKDKSEVTEEEYNEFHKFLAGGFEAPLYRLHFRTDVPIDVKSLLYVPRLSLERLGTGRVPHGTSLYSRKVLLKQSCEELLPNWLRFIQGVVDSEDLPISLSRENMQDSRLMAKIKTLLTKRIIKWFKEEAKKNPEDYVKNFYSEFGGYLKEGVCQDYANKLEIAKLLRFHSSELDNDKMTSLDEYISRCAPEQKKIYYLMSPSLKTARDSPYLEVFKKQGIEVLLVHSNIDDFVMSNLQAFQDHDIMNAAMSDIEKHVKHEDETNTSSESVKMSEDDQKELVEWMEETLKGTASKVTSTTRLYTSPAVVAPNQSVGVRRLLKNINHQVAGVDTSQVDPQHLQINPKHPIMTQLFGMRNKNPDLAREYAETLYHSAVLAAGLTDDPSDVVPKLHRIMEKLTAYKEV